ncbi:MAG TPA: hypothetical protein VM575_16715 [Nocardioides sp.]|jgi:RNA polymerase sigma-70 factor (ECF subfamily)|nr:hypothetical protein [Nocardioides sp.]
MDTAHDLADLLLASARGDRDAFRRFYDATSSRAFGLELVRARSRAVPYPRATAERATTDRFIRAWRAAPEYAGSGLSPLAWLLSLPTSGPAERAVACIEEAIA